MHFSIKKNSLVLTLENRTLMTRSYYHGKKLQLFDHLSEEGQMVRTLPKTDEIDVCFIEPVYEYPNS